MAYLNESSMLTVDSKKIVPHNRIIFYMRLRWQELASDVGDRGRRFELGPVWHCFHSSCEQPDRVLPSAQNQC